MKKLVSAVFAVALAAAAGVAFADDDEGAKVAPNALRTIESNTPAQMPNDTANDEGAKVAPNAQVTHAASQTSQESDKPAD